MQSKRRHHLQIPLSIIDKNKLKVYRSEGANHRNVGKRLIYLIAVFLTSDWRMPFVDRYHAASWLILDSCAKNHPPPSVRDKHRRDDRTHQCIYVRIRSAVLGSLGGYTTFHCAAVG